MTEVLRSFINPVYNSNASFTEKKDAFQKAIFFILKGYGIFMLLLIVDSIQASITNMPLFSNAARSNQLLKVTPSIWLFLFVAFIAPIIEELTFRSFMDRSRLMIAVSIGALLLMFLRLSDVINHEYKSVIELTISLTTGLLSFAILEKVRFTFKDHHFRLVFYGMNALFVIMHLGNYKLEEFSIANFIFLPVILLPQTMMTIALSYVRLNGGLLWSIALHMVNNLIPALLFVLLKHS